MMERKCLTTEKNWVVFTMNSVLYFETFIEALENQKVLGGHLMTKTYYDSYYSKLVH